MFCSLEDLRVPSHRTNPDSDLPAPEGVERGRKSVLQKTSRNFRKGRTRKGNQQTVDGTRLDQTNHQHFERKLIHIYNQTINHSFFVQPYLWLIYEKFSLIFFLQIITFGWWALFLLEIRLQYFWITDIVIQFWKSKIKLVNFLQYQQGRKHMYYIITTVVLKFV